MRKKENKVFNTKAEIADLHVSVITRERILKDQCKEIIDRMSISDLETMFDFKILNPHSIASDKMLKDPYALNISKAEIMRCKELDIHLFSTELVIKYEDVHNDITR